MSPCSRYTNRLYSRCRRRNRPACPPGRPGPAGGPPPGPAPGRGRVKSEVSIAAIRSVAETSNALMNEVSKAIVGKKNVLEKFGSTGVQQVLDNAVFELLNYITVYPVADAGKLIDKENNILPDCFLIPKESTSSDFAFRVHTDIGKNFIRAVDAKTKMVVGKDHVLKNGDVLEIVTSK